MIKLQLETTDDVTSTINKIKSLKDLNIELVIPKGSILFENSLNLKLIQHEADKMEKSVEYYTEDEIGNNLILGQNGKEISSFGQAEPENEIETPVENKKKLSLPKINLPRIPSVVPNFPKIRKGPILIALGVLLFVGSFIVYGSRTPVVTAKISVRAQPLTRSVTITVKAGSATDVKAKILKGSTLSTTIDNTMDAATTGSKIIGEKASGKVTIYNYTSSKVTLDKNTKVTYKGRSTDLVYTLDDSVTIDAATVTFIPSESSVTTPSSANVDITATDIGDSYNISDGKTLEVKGYDKDHVVGKTKGDITGGKSETVKIVTADDRTNLSSSLLADTKTKAETEIRNKLATNQKLIAGSIETKISKETFSKNVGDQADKISLTQSAVAGGLLYFDNDLNRFLDEYVKDLIPNNYVLSSQNREVNVEVLGKSTNSVLSSTVADIQVTLKTFVVPDIKEEDVKKQLIGKNPTEAEKILGSIKNINTYEFKLSPTIPFFRRVPNDMNRIHLTITKD